MANASLTCDHQLQCSLPIVMSQWNCSALSIHIKNSTIRPWCSKQTYHHPATIARPT